MDKTEAARTARRALEILDRDGWNKGALTKRDNQYLAPSWCVTEDYLRVTDYLRMTAPYKTGSHCIGGAWNLALREGNDDWWWAQNTSRYEPLADKIVELFPDVLHSSRSSFLDLAGLIVGWNNSPDITEEDVRTVLEKIATDD